MRRWLSAYLAYLSVRSNLEWECREVYARVRWARARYDAERAREYSAFIL